LARKAFHLIVCLSVLFSFSCHKKVPIFTNAKVFLNGLYRSETKDYKNSGYSYFRFFEDKTVVSATIVINDNELIEVMKWFNNQDQNVLKGRYCVEGSHIQFQVCNTNGCNEYEGEIQSDGAVLDLRYKSMTNGEGRGKYIFMRLY
jgi:hypothetical protein